MAVESLPNFTRLARQRRGKSFAVIESERTINGKTSFEHRCYISSLPADA